MNDNYKPLIVDGFTEGEEVRIIFSDLIGKITEINEGRIKPFVVTVTENMIKAFSVSSDEIAKINKSELPKPPLGLRPKFIVTESRIQEIKEAIERYIAVNYAIPAEWIEEYNELVTHVKT